MLVGWDNTPPAWLDPYNCIIFKMLCTPHNDANAAFTLDCVNISADVFPIKVEFLLLIELGRKCSSVHSRAPTNTEFISSANMLSAADAIII